MPSCGLRTEAETEEEAAMRPRRRFAAMRSQAQGAISSWNKGQAVPETPQRDRGPACILVWGVWPPKL